MVPEKIIFQFSIQRQRIDLDPVQLRLKAIYVEILPRSLVLIGGQIDSIWNQMFYMHSARGLSVRIYSHQIYSNFSTQKHPRYPDILKNVNIVNLQSDVWDAQ